MGGLFDMECPPPGVLGSVAGSSPDLQFGERLLLKLSLSVTPQLHGTDPRAINLDSCGMEGCLESLGRDRGGH